MAVRESDVCSPIMSVLSWTNLLPFLLFDVEALFATSAGLSSRLWGPTRLFPRWGAQPLRLPGIFGIFPCEVHQERVRCPMSQGRTLVSQRAGKMMSQYPFSMSQWAVWNALIDEFKWLEVRLSMRHTPFPGKILPWGNAGSKNKCRLTVAQYNLSYLSIYVEAVAVHVVCTVTVTFAAWSPALWLEETCELHCGLLTRCSFEESWFFMAVDAFCWLEVSSEVAAVLISHCCTTV